MPEIGGFSPACAQTAGNLRGAKAGLPTGAALAAKVGAGEGNRTLVISLEGCCSTIELHPQMPETLADFAVSVLYPGRQAGLRTSFIGDI